MKNTVSRIMTGLLLAILMTSGAAAQTMYVDDVIYVPMRSGEGNQYRIIQPGLRSGTPVEVIEQNEDTGYSFVRLADGEEGYIATRYLSEQRIAAERLEDTSAELEQTRQTLRNAQTELEERENDLRELRQRETQLENELEQVSDELAQIREVSEDAININERNEQLQTETQELKREVELLSTENQRLKDRKDSDFLLMGGALVIAGIFIAVIFPLLKPSRKSEGWS